MSCSLPKTTCSRSWPGRRLWRVGWRQQRSVVRVLGTNAKGHGRRRAAHRCRELRPDLAAWEKNLLVVSSALHRNVHKWLGNRPCEPKDFVDYLLRNELSHFEASPSTRARQEVRQQKLIHRLELLQARDEGNRLLY